MLTGSRDLLHGTQIGKKYEIQVTAVSGRKPGNSSMLKMEQQLVSCNREYVALLLEVFFNELPRTCVCVILTIGHSPYKSNR